MATDTDSGEGAGNNAGPNPITAPFDWGLGIANAPAAAEPVEVSEPATELISHNARPAPYFSSDSDEDADPASPIDSLFGETRFSDYEDEPMIGPIPAELNPFASAKPVASAVPSLQPNETPIVASPPREPPAAISKNQRLMFWIAGGVIALLVLTLLFVLGTKIATPAVSVAVVTSATPKASSPQTPAPAQSGQAAVGPHLWSDLRGGECVDPYTNPFQLKYAVVDCAAPHPAQMAFRGTFPGEVTAAYPGLESLQSQINLLCTAPGVIDLATAGAYSDIQFQASYAVTADEWTKGQHDYFCFVNRAGGDPITGSVAGTPAK